MDNKWVKVFMYQLITPKLDPSGTGSYLEERFDENHFISFLRKIMDQPLQDRIFDTGDKVMTLESFSLSDDADFYEGHFTAFRYGEVTNLVHRRTFRKRPSDKTIDEGDENNVYFVIERVTGRLFLQSDGKRLVTRNSIDKYLRNFYPLFENDINQINRMISPLMITPMNLYAIKTIYAESFYEEINKLLRIKKATMQVKFNQDINSDVVNAIRAGAEGVDGADTIEYALINKERRGSMRKVEQFLRNLEEINKYENIVVEGTEESGKPKAIKLEDHPKDFSIKVSVNENGIISFQELINGIIDKVKRSSI
ncbi:hypothetical protein PUS82_15225 [Cytobacillus firmus]|uniref:hypothetical protein n=1 Tax=Cytobacillus firmus TaxID=1399 RepID=UPI00237A6162|nr:hypothetical protein [Cytobacillus firmus]MDD9312625.1 hypothetical protein [Cytobacillus firmus]